jgi:hypothetical protein
MPSNITLELVDGVRVVVPDSLNLGFGSEEMQRRLMLIQRRFGATKS